MKLATAVKKSDGPLVVVYMKGCPNIIMYFSLKTAARISVLALLAGKSFILIWDFIHHVDSFVQYDMQARSITFNLSWLQLAGGLLLGRNGLEILSACHFLIYGLEILSAEILSACHFLI